jgi:hypothetical protein
MKKQDDRTAEQKVSHNMAVVAKDKFMSGWGGAKDGSSRCAWACKDSETLQRVKHWVDDRDEMIYVNIIDLDTYRPPSGTAHFHIYIVGESHPALN